MNISEIEKILSGNIVCGKKRALETVNYGFSSDLLSDVLTLEVDSLILITGLVNVQTIRTAEMSEISKIVFARGKKVSQEMIQLAEQNDMVLMECECSVFKASGLLFKAGLKSVY